MMYIPFYGERYEVTPDGEIYSNLSKRLMSNQKQVVLKDLSGKFNQYSIQYVVLSAYKQIPLEDLIHHRILYADSNCNNVRPENLIIENMNDLPGELWRRIETYKNYQIMNIYQVSNMGRVKCSERMLGTRIIPEHFVTFTLDNKKRYRVACLLSKDNYSVNVLLHRLVAEAFLDNPNHFPQVNHKDGNKDNNKLSNLEWVTAKQNIDHAFHIGLKQPVGCKKVKCVETGKVFESMSEADRWIGRSSGYVSNCICKHKESTSVSGDAYHFELI